MPRPATSAKPAPTKAATPVLAQPRLRVWLMAVLLALGTIAVYWPATRCDFINYDDPDFVTSNAHVQGGLNWESVKWAFRLNEGDYWHPLTWLSLMLDASLLGQGAGGFHFTNVAFHAANSVLLFGLLRLLTGSLWRSMVVAALFALHPLRVESVAWVTERKDVLSGFFGLLSLIAYARYAQRQRAVISNQSSVISRQSAGSAAGDYRTRTTAYRLLTTDHRLLFYLLSLCFLALGLMSKPMLVTLPCVMLLLDYWPLKRMQNVEASDTHPPSRFTFHVSRFTHHVLPLLFEKIPFFVLSGISCVLTYLTERGPQQTAGFVESPALHRLESAFVAYARYLGKTFWPVELAVPYVNPDHWSWVEVGTSFLLVAGVGLAVFWLGRRWPYLLVGWCWFLGTLVPVVGLTPGWGTFMADRFTYVPSIGMLILAVWGVCEMTRCRRYQLLALSVAGGTAIVLCLALTRQQLGYWKDSEALFRHTLQVTENNDVAHNCLGVALGKKDQTEEAIRQYQEAIRLKPDRPMPHYNLGVAFAKAGQTDEAIRQYREAIRLKPDHANAHNSLGHALFRKGQTEEAIRQYQEALRLQPDHTIAHYDLGLALDQEGRTDEAIRQYREAIRLKPDQRRRPRQSRRRSLPERPTRRGDPPTAGSPPPEPGSRRRSLQPRRRPG
ncbi:MAG: tetratricopeptide repeat protein [Verrucomicrobia bacterium]|nr:tetratricopeptide repeat protein [Verrucomicrobiota bacterium]